MLVLCKSCGWVEQPKVSSSATSTTAKGFLLGLKMAIWMLAGMISLFGYYLKAAGALFVAVGVATAIFGIGFLFMAVGYLFMAVANIPLVLGRLVRMITGGGGGVTQCPSCGSSELIPTHTPVGRKLMADLGIEPPVEPENELPWWQRGLAYAGGLLLAFIVLVVIPTQIWPGKPKPSQPIATIQSVEPATTKPVHGKAKGHKAKSASVPVPPTQ